MLWPGEKFEVPYTLEELYHRIGEYLTKHLTKHPKATFARTHWHCVQSIGVCKRTHAYAVWILYKANQKHSTGSK